MGYKETGTKNGTETQLLEDEIFLFRSGYLLQYPSGTGVSKYLTIQAPVQALHSNMTL